LASTFASDSLSSRIELVALTGVAR
jgi:hypothetical protein